MKSNVSLWWLFFKDPFCCIVRSLSIIHLKILVCCLSCLLLCTARKISLYTCTGTIKYSDSDCITPVKHARSDSNPIRIGSEALARSGPDDPRPPACFRTGSVWPKPDTVSQNNNRIRAGFAQHDPGRLWKNATQSESGKLVAGRLRSAKNRAR